MIQNDIEKIMITEEQIQERIKELGAQLTEEYKEMFPLAVGVLKGAMPFMTDHDETFRFICGTGLYGCYFIWKCNCFIWGSKNT